VLSLALGGIINLEQRAEMKCDEVEKRERAVSVEHVISWCSVGSDSERLGTWDPATSQLLRNLTSHLESLRVFSRQAITCIQIPDLIGQFATGRVKPNGCARGPTGM
jgi:hypothetical protein